MRNRRGQALLPPAPVTIFRSGADGSKGKQVWPRQRHGRRAGRHSRRGSCEPGTVAAAVQATGVAHAADPAGDCRHDHRHRRREPDRRVARVTAAAAARVEPASAPANCSAPRAISVCFPQSHGMTNAFVHSSNLDHVRVNLGSCTCIVIERARFDQYGQEPRSCSEQWVQKVES